MIIGSQAILASWPDAPALLRRSGEIDAYPANAREWEAKNPGHEASEEIFALFGEASAFHLAHGFYIDGVDETTATLPKDWRARELRTPVQDGSRTIYAITPELHDLAVAKLCRLEEKDRAFATELVASGRLQIATALQRLQGIDAPASIKQRAETFLRDLKR